MQLRHFVMRLSPMRNDYSLSVNIKPGFFLSLALLIVLLPVQLVLCWLVASIVHELGHLISLKCMRIRLFSLTLDFSGAIIGTDTMHPFQEIACALAGPLFSLSILLLLKKFPMVAMFALAHSCYNLLPFYPLDGGRSLYNLLVYLKGEVSAIQTAIVINKSILILLFPVSIAFTIRYKLGLFPIIFAILLFLRMQKFNYTLKR